MTVSWSMNLLSEIQVSLLYTFLLGIPDGKFLEKRKYKNINNNNEFFTPGDLIVGNEIQINGWKF